MTETLVFESYESLEPFSPVEPKLLSEKISGYPQALAKAQKAYRSYRSSFTGADNRPYQAEYAALMALRRYNIMGYSMGVGKTSITLLTIQTLYERLSKEATPYRAGLVHICVPSLLAVARWVEELERMPALRHKYRVITKEKDLLTAPPQGKSSEILLYTHDFPKGKSKRLTRGTKNSLAHYLSKYYRPAFLIIDEVHGLRGGTQRTGALSYLRGRARRVLVLSGTLSDGNLAQIHSLCKFVYREHWPYRSPQAFSALFGQKQRLDTNYLYGSARHTEVPEKYLQKLDPSKLGTYYALMRHFIHRVKIDEPQVAPYLTLPAQTVELHEIEPTTEQKAATATFITTHRSALAAAAQAVTVTQKAAVLRLIHPLIELANFPTIPSNKPSRLLEIVQAATGKVVVFCSYVGSARYVHEFLINQLGTGTAVRLYANDPELTPSTLTTKARQEVLDSFRYNDQVRVAVLSINLASEAIEFPTASDTVFYCMPWSSYKLEQSVHRVVRPGNRHTQVGTHYLYQKGMIDEHQVALAIEKIKASRLLLDYELDANVEEVDLSPAEALRQLLAG
jgi:superfamily II DNA or RNA helicase